MWRGRGTDVALESKWCKNIATILHNWCGYTVILGTWGPIPNEDKNQVTELRRVLRESDTQLQSARDRVKRLEKKEDAMNKSYEELKKKNEEKLEGHMHDNLADLKRATFNHFLTKWENANEHNAGDDISELKNAFPLAIRKFFPKEIKENKDSLK